MIGWARLLFCCFLMNLIVAPSHASDLEDLHGVYLGYAIATDSDGAISSEREMNVIIEPYKRNGLRLKWSSVVLQEGRRDRPGVNYRADELLLLPDESGQYFIASTPHNPFETKEKGEAIGGAPLRWATYDRAGLRVFSFVILEDGRFELQRYDRRLTEDGMKLRFQRIVDGKIRREVVGFARRAILPQ